MFEPVKQVFLVLLSFSGSLANKVNTPNQIKFIFLNNQQCMIQPIDLHPNEYSAGLRYYPLPVDFDRS